VHALVLDIYNIIVNHHHLYCNKKPYTESAFFPPICDSQRRLTLASLTLNNHMLPPPLSLLTLSAYVLSAVFSPARIPRQISSSTNQALSSVSWDSSGSGKSTPMSGKFVRLESMKSFAEPALAQASLRVAQIANLYRNTHSDIIVSYFCAGHEKSK
jgi:hypothetical protein